MAMVVSLAQPSHTFVNGIVDARYQEAERSQAFEVLV